jgi:hypothetical protein
MTYALSGFISLQGHYGQIVFSFTTYKHYENGMSYKAGISFTYSVTNWFDFGSGISYESNNYSVDHGEGTHLVNEVETEDHSFGWIAIGYRFQKQRL